MYTKELKGENLIAAINAPIAVVGELGDVDPGLHQGNIMWRMVGYQPQLVITDSFVGY